MAGHFGNAGFREVHLILDGRGVGAVFVAVAVMLGAAFAPNAAAAQDQGNYGKVIRVAPNAFSADAGLITFAEKPLGTRNPRYLPSAYGAVSGSITVRFGGYFRGQGIASSGQCPPGANRNGCITGRPSAPLQLASASPPAVIHNDRSNPRSPALSGSPSFNGAVSMVFDRDVAGVGLAGGYFNAKRSTAIQAFDRNGAFIGGVKNIGLGMEYLALVTEDGSNRIAGIQFSLVGPERAGYAIDDVRLALASQINRSQVPGLKDVLGDVRYGKADGDGAAQEKPRSLADVFAEPPKSAGDAAGAGGLGAGGPAPVGSLRSILGD